LSELPRGDVSTVECRKLVDEFTANYRHLYDWTYVFNKKLCLIQTEEYLGYTGQARVTRIIDLGLRKPLLVEIWYENGKFSYEKYGNFVDSLDIRSYWNTIKLFNK